LVTELILQAESVGIPSWLITLVIGAVMLAAGTFIASWKRHSEVSISGPVEIRVLQENEKRLEKRLDDGFGENRETLKQIDGKLGKMVISQERTTWEYFTCLTKRIGTMHKSYKSS
jgi:hypothetical protein